LVLGRGVVVVVAVAVELEVVDAPDDAGEEEVGALELGAVTVVKPDGEDDAGTDADEVGKGVVAGPKLDERRGGPRGDPAVVAGTNPEDGESRMTGAGIAAVSDATGESKEPVIWSSEKVGEYAVNGLLPFADFIVEEVKAM